MSAVYEIRSEDGAITAPNTTSKRAAFSTAQALAVQHPGVTIGVYQYGKPIARWALPPDFDAGQRAREERTRRAEEDLMGGVA